MEPKPVKHLPLTKLLGIALIAGGVTVGVVLIILISSYASAGKLSSVNATIAIIAALLLLVLPQLGLGSYLIWFDMRETAVTNPNENPSSE